MPLTSLRATPTSVVLLPVLNTRELWESLLTEEQKEQLAAGTLAIPANVSTPGDGSFFRQWWYDQQDAETQALIDSGELEYPEKLQPANFTDSFALGDNTKINLNANGTASFRSGEAQIREAGSGGQNRTQLYLNGASTLNDDANALNISRDGTNTINLYYGGSASFGSGNITLNANGKASFGGTNSNAWVNVEVAKDSGTSYGIRVAPYEVTTARGDYFTFVANGPALSGAGTMNEAQRYYARMLQADVGATTNYMFRSEANNSTVAGQTNYNFYAGGNAPNYFKGKIYGANCNLPQVNDITKGFFKVYAVNEAATTKQEAPITIAATNDDTFPVDGRYVMASVRANGASGSIRMDENGHFAFGNPSDYRLKSNIQSVGSVVDKIKNINVVSYDLIDGGSIPYGFVAHELQEQVPEAVTATKDATITVGTITNHDGTVYKTDTVEPDTFELEYTEETTDENGVTAQAIRTRTWSATGTRPVYQDVDPMKLIPLLTKALQEALERIENLESNTNPEMSSISELTNKVNAIEAENSLVATLVQNISSRLDSIDDAITALQNPSTPEPEVNLIPDEWSQDQRLAAMQELLNEYNANK